ncbi:MAG: serine/threonine protein kinase [Spirochaetaceae bacterium]
MDNIPSQIGKYKIVELIAKGGMGAVYKGIHPTLDRYVILKKLTLKDNDEFIQRFNREARIMMDFKNDNIVDVYDHFKEKKSYYIVLEYVDGIALDAFILKEGRVENDLALYIILEISKALKYAHNKGVVHRDIKPANILLAKDGGIKLVDFGIAISDEEFEEDLTTIGMTLGTPSYMAPEQFENSKNVDKRADIYSLGVMLFEMVTGEKPYPSGLTPSCIAKIQKGKRKSAKKLNKSINYLVMYYIRNLMHHNIKKRTQDLEIVISKLKRYFNNQKMDIYKTRLSDTVCGNETTELPVVKKRKYIIPIICSVLFILLLGFWGYKTLEYEFFKVNSYGAVQINLSVNKSYYKEIDEIYIKSKLFIENGTKLDLLPDSNYQFDIKAESDTLDFNYKTKKIYLPVGFYRYKVMVDGNLFWLNFQILSLKKQRLNPETLNGLILDMKHTEPEQLPFHPEISVIDQITRIDITEEATVYIQKNMKFEKFNKDDKSLRTGQTHYFQISKKGYYLKDYILKISPDQTDLELRVELFPKPGEIIIETNQPSIKLKIDNKKYYTKADLTQELIYLSKIKDVRQIMLTVGTHNLLFYYKGNVIEYDVLIEPGKTQSITVNYNLENRSMSIME